MALLGARTRDPCPSVIQVTVANICIHLYIYNYLSLPPPIYLCVSRYMQFFVHLEVVSGESRFASNIAFVELQ